MHQLSQFYAFCQDLDFAFLILFFIVAGIQIFYYSFFYIRIFSFKFKDKPEYTFDQPVSIIIAAHNESENLKNFLPSILEQDYPKFEVIIINDRSEDDSATVIAEFQQKYKHLRSTFIKPNGKIQYGKKLALTLGIKAAQYEYVLLSDADCKPNSDQWIKQMTHHFESKDIVLGYGPYYTEPGFLNKLIRFDTLFIALQYMTFSKAGIPYMGIGRNLAYKKECFINNRGIASHAHIASGDDDLFINEVANSKNTAIGFQEESFMYSVPEDTYKFWIRQKQRHLTTFSRYKTKHQILLSTEVFSRLLFYILLFGLISSQLNNIYFWSVVGLRILLSFSILFKSTRVFKEKKLSLLLIFFDFIFPILNFFIFLEAKKPKNAK